MSPGHAAWLRAALTMLCPFQLSLCSPPKRCPVTTCRNCFCRVTLCPFGEGRVICFPDAPAAVTCLTPATNTTLRFETWTSSRTGLPDMSVSSSKRLFVLQPEGKDLYTIHRTWGERGLGRLHGPWHWWEALRTRTSSERCQAWGVFGHMAPAGVPKGSVLCTISPRWVCQLDLMGCNYFRSSANRSLLM